MKALRTGITTGVCAAAAARAATQAALGGAAPDRVEIALPDGTTVSVPVAAGRGEGPGRGRASVRKDAGDDADVTDGLEVIALVGTDEPAPAGPAVEVEGVRLIAGEGVGVVTLPGLQAAVGEPAINPVPRRMIASAVRSVTDRPCWVQVGVAGGRQAAARTFNPRLGVAGGLSILGTTGIVRPYSHQAIRETIRCAIRVASACGVRRPVLCPGNIGARAAARLVDLQPQQLIEVSNEWACAMDEVAAGGFDGVMAVGHPGKLGKLAAGEWDTHSSRSAPAVDFVSGLAAQVLARRVEPARTVEGLLSGLPAAQRRAVGDVLGRHVLDALAGRTGPRMDLAVLLIDMQGALLGRAGKVDAWPTRPE